MTTETEDLFKLPDGYHALKYREKWAHGYGKWEWVIYVNPMTVEEVENEGSIIAEDRNTYYYWSDKFRGMEWHAVNEVPPSVLLNHIRNAVNKIAMYEQQAVTMKNWIGENK